MIDTPNTFLYLVLGNGRALRYGIGVGREGFTWAGTKTVEKKAEWPDWHPPQEMIERQPYLPRFMAGGPGNPLGARAMYLSGSVYRIHGTNAPQTIGQRVSSGCIRLTNEDVSDLYERVTVGAKVVVLPMNGPRVSNRSGSAPLIRFPEFTGDVRMTPASAGPASTCVKFGPAEPNYSRSAQAARNRNRSCFVDGHEDELMSGELPCCQPITGASPSRRWPQRFCLARRPRPSRSP